MAVLTASQVAKVLQIHVNTVYRLLAEGKIKGAYRIGNSWRIRSDKLLDGYFETYFVSDDINNKISN